MLLNPPYNNLLFWSGASDEVVKSYRTTWRFDPSPETQAVVDAKFQAMETVDLLLNMEFNTRLEVSQGRPLRVHEYTIVSP